MVNPGSSFIEAFSRSIPLCSMQIIKVSFLFALSPTWSCDLERQWFDKRLFHLLKDVPRGMFNLPSDFLEEDNNSFIR